MTEDNNKEQRDAAFWAHLTSALQVARVPTGALNLNVDGRQVVGPLQGFGCLWQKTYRLHLPEVMMTPAEIMQIWKENFAQCFLIEPGVAKMRVKYNGCGTRRELHFAEK